MLSSKILTGRTEREAGLESQAEPSGSPASPTSPCPHARPKLWICDQQGDVQGASLLTSTALGERRGLHACCTEFQPPRRPESFFLERNNPGTKQYDPAPYAVRGTGITPRLTPLPPAASLDRETSRTDPALLDELLPFMTHPVSEPRMGATGCTLHLAKAALGAGLVAVPHAFVLVRLLAPHPPTHKVFQRSPDG